MKTLSLALLFSFAAGCPVGSAELIAGHGQGALAQVEWQKLSGWVSAKDADNRRLSLRDRNGNVTRITVDENVQIFRDWRLIALNDVRLNDRLILKRTDSGLQ